MGQQAVVLPAYYLHFSFVYLILSILLFKMAVNLFFITKVTDVHCKKLS